MELLHIGVPATKEMPNEKYKDAIKCYITNPDENEYHFEYFRYLEDSPMPKQIWNNVHVAYKVDNLKEALAACDEVLLEEMQGTGRIIGFGVKDGVVLELMEYTK